jgi:hypothetical protein
MLKGNVLVGPKEVRLGLRVCVEELVAGLLSQIW